MRGYAIAASSFMTVMRKPLFSLRILALALASSLAYCSSTTCVQANDRDSRSSSRNARKAQRAEKQRSIPSSEKPTITGSAIPYESVAAWESKKSQHTVFVVDRRAIETSGAATLAGVLRRRGTLR